MKNYNYMQSQYPNRELKQVFFFTLLRKLLAITVDSGLYVQSYYRLKKRVKAGSLLYTVTNIIGYKTAYSGLYVQSQYRPKQRVKAGNILYTVTNIIGYNSRFRMICILYSLSTVSNRELMQVFFNTLLRIFQDIKLFIKVIRIVLVLFYTL